jgi:hypothetical protein
MNLFRHADYAFTPPNSWEDHSVVAMSGPADGETAPPNLTIVRDTVNEGTTAKMYAGNQLESLKAAFARQQFEVLSEWADTCQSGPVYCRTNRLLLDGENRMIVQHQGYAIGGTDAFILTVSDSIEQIQQSARIFREILASFRWGSESEHVEVT